MSHAQIGERTWIDEAADRFECDWKRGGDRPRIEDFMAEEAGPRRILLLQELLQVERELRESAGETPLPEEYRQRFPDDSAAIDGVFGIGAHAPKPSTEPPVAAAQSLLFGLLAMQNSFIDRDTLLAAFNAWVANKSQPLRQILLDRGALSPARHAVLQVLVQEHLLLHGLDPERSLSVLSIIPSVRDDLEELPDFDPQASLLYLRIAAAGEDTAGESTASWEGESAATDTEGRFRIIRFHDRGALGEVYVARDQQLHRMVTLKRIKLDHATDRDKRARFVVEAEITGRLEHPGIVPVYGLGTYDDGRPFYAMRFIRGDNLKSAIEQFHQDEERGRDPGERALALLKLLRRFLDVCNAIDYAHSRGVLHRDLKPGLKKVERGDFSRPRKLKGWIDPALEAICVKAMATDPAGRYRSPRALADDVEHWLADEPVTAWQEPWARGLLHWVKRHRTVVVGACAAMLAALMGLGAVSAVEARANDALYTANTELRVAKEEVTRSNEELRASRDREHQRFNLARRELAA